MTPPVVIVLHFGTDRTTAYGRTGTRVHYDGTGGRLVRMTFGRICHKPSFIASSLTSRA